MKKLLFISILFFSVNLFGQGDFYKTPDSKLHLQYSVGVSAISQMMFSEAFKLPPLEALVYSSGFDLIGYTFKEIVIDRNFSSSDMLHNVVGLIIGKTISYIYFTFIKKDSVAYFYHREHKKLNKFISLELTKSNQKKP